MKRERLISSAVDQAEDSLFPFVYNMMENRNFGIATINEMFGLNIKVDFGSVWALKNKKLVDGVTGNNNETINNGIPDAANSEQPPEQDENGKPKTPDNGNDNVEPSQNHDAVDDTEQGKNNDPDNNQDNQQDNEKVDLNDEQKQRQSDSQNVDGDSGTVSESEKQIADLQAVIDDPETSEADKQAAQELLNEIKSKE